MRFARVDGVDLLARVYRPVVRDMAHCAIWPVVVHAVGGGWMAGGRLHDVELHSQLAAAGVVSVVPDLRSGLGHRHPAAATDFERVLRWVHEQADELHIDRSAVVVAGSWSGAHAALTAVLTSRTLRRLGVPASLVMRWPTIDPLTVLRRGEQPARTLDPTPPAISSVIDASAADYFGEPERMRRAGVPELVFDGAAVQLPTMWITRSDHEPFAPGDAVDELVFAWRRGGGRALAFDTVGFSAEQVNDATRVALTEAARRCLEPNYREVVEA
ncbi:MAG: acetyl esterase/lipase [Candidatus Poriferisodalaceae bacterium]|jgi:acetyl esterase/lipase